MSRNSYVSFQSVILRLSGEVTKKDKREQAMRSPRNGREAHTFVPDIAAARAKLALGVLLLLLAVALTGCTREEMLYDHLDANRPALYIPTSDDARVIPFEIELGTPARVISEQLAMAGLIHDAELFEAYVRSIGRAQELKAGTFLLRANMTLAEIAEALLDAQAAGISVTIREGWRLEQIADSLEKEGIVSGVEYRATAEIPDMSALDQVASNQSTTASQEETQTCCAAENHRWPFLNERPQGASLEGFLFPAKYQLPAVEPKAVDLIARQLDAFAARIMPIYLQAEADGVNPLNLYESLILASIVEREAVLAEDRPVIAGVFLNRLANGMWLESDATVQYGMGYQAESGQWWKTPVFLEEFQEVHSPFNTYRHGGLPPGPIASPGEDSFRAVLYPQRHSYFYYAANADGGGGHVFAETYAEHLENVRRYLNQ